MNESLGFSAHNESPPLPFAKDESFSNGMFMDVSESYVDEGYVVKQSRASFAESSAAEKIEAYKNEYRMLRQYLGDHIPDTVFLTVSKSEDEADEYVKMVQQRVFENNEDNTDLAAQRKKEIEQFMISALDIFEDSLDQGTGTGSFLDVKSANVIFGHTVSDPKDKLYFIDFSGSLRTMAIEDFIASYQVRMTDLKVDSDAVNARLDKIKELADAYYLD